MKTIALDSASPVATAMSVPQVAAHPYRLLGSYRFLLATLVLVSHASGFLPNVFDTLALGNVGVLLFFVVSGFVISEALDIFYRRSTTRFLLNRALKIYPAYLAALPLAYLARIWVGEPAATDPFGLLVNISLLLAYLPRGNTLLVISVAWAIVIEFQFYLTAAVIFRIARSAPRLPVPFIAATLALVAYLWVWQTGGYHRFYGGLQFAPFFVLGALVYFVIAHRDVRLVAPVGIAFLLAVHAYYRYNAMGVPPDAGPAWNVIASTGLFIALVGVMVRLAMANGARSFERVDKRLGDLTYAVYLVHPSVIFVIVPLHLGDAVSFVLTAAASFGLAMLIRRLVERPIVRLRNTLRRHQLYD